MIRQLPEPCWYFDCDPWEEPHFPTEAAALSHEAERASDCECAPRPVLRTAAGCWVADCDRCERPLDDEDDCFAEVHFDGQRGLTARLDAAGWRAVRDGLCYCPPCAAARPPVGEVARVPVRVRAGDTSWQVTGEATACSQLAITVLRDEPRGRWQGVVLTHRPTGHRLPLDAWTDDAGVLHRVAELLAHLDWSSPDPAHYATGYPEQLLAAVHQALDEHAPAAGTGAAAGQPARPSGRTGEL